MRSEKEQMEKEIRISAKWPVTHRWSGKFVGKDALWKHMERQLVDYELMVVEKGVLYIEDEWGQYEVHEGEWLLMEPTRLQKGFRQSKCRFYWMHFFLPVMPDGEDAQGTAFSLTKYGKLKYADRVYVLFKQLHDSDIRFMDPVYNGLLATTLLCEIHEQAVNGTSSDLRSEEDGGKKGGANRESLRGRVDDYLLSHMGQHISVGELAMTFGYHEKYFSSLFKEETGQSVKKYVDGRKMERAKYLLLNTDALVVEIAQNLGYEEVQNFYHVFKGFTNCTPTEFRETYSKKQEFDV